MHKKTAKHLDVRKGHKSSAIVPGAYSSLSDHELRRDFIQWWAQYQRCLIWHSWQCESGRESPGGLVFFIFTYSQEPSVYIKKLFWVFFWETSPAAWSSSTHLKEEKSRLISCESHRVSLNAYKWDENQMTFTSEQFLCSGEVSTYTQDLYGSYLLQVSSCNTRHFPTPAFSFTPVPLSLRK